MLLNRKNFNKQGDLILLGDTNIKNSELGDKCKFDKLSLSDNNIFLFKKLIEKCKEKNAKLYFLFPCYAKTELIKNQKVINILKKQLQSDIEFIEIINEPETFAFDEKYFNGTVYHLNKEGRKSRTNLLIDVLKNKI